MKLRIKLVAEVMVEDPAHYEAKTIEEAAVNAEKWIDTGVCPIDDILSDANIVDLSIEGVK